MSLNIPRGKPVTIVDSADGAASDESNDNEDAPKKASTFIRRNLSHIGSSRGYAQLIAVAGLVAELISCTSKIYLIRQSVS